MMLSDNLPIVKDLPSPEGRWELVEVIGECVCEIMNVRIINFCQQEIPHLAIQSVGIDMILAERTELTQR